MPPKNKTKLTLYVDSDITEFVRQHGGQRRTDLLAGKVNVSAEVNDFLHRLMSEVTPETVGSQVARRKEELVLEIEAVDHQAEELLGFSTIEEWQADQVGRERSRSDVLSQKKQIREEIHAELWQTIETQFGKMRQGRSYKKRQNLAWLRTRFKHELRTLSVTPEETLARLERESRSPEVA